MPLPSAELILSQYLYGSAAKPPLDNEALIRDKIGTYGATINVDAAEYMTLGGGRFANGAQSALVNSFYNSTDPRLTSGPATYTMQEMQSILGVSSSFNFQQYNYKDGINDFGDRCLLWNSSSFKISDEARFVIDSNGNRFIENYSIKPFDDNYDYDSPNWVAWASSEYLRHYTDPSDIGWTVELKMVIGALPTKTYSRADFLADQLYENQHYVPVNISDIKSHVDPILDRLAATPNGPTSFIFDGHPIIYGSGLNDGGLDASLLNSYQENAASAGLIIIAGKGNDTATGGQYTDTIHGGNGNDVLTGSLGKDALFGASGSDIIYGINKTDFATAPGADLIVGGDGADQEWGSGASNVIFGDDLSQTEVKTSWFSQLTNIKQQYPSFYVEGSASGADTINAGDGNDLILGGGGADSIKGGAANDTLAGDAGSDVIEGNDGNDTFYGGSGSDRMEGGAGLDEVYYRGGAAVKIDFDNVANSTGNASGDRFFTIEKITGSDGNDTVVGSLSGVDEISLASGNDLIRDYGGEGAVKGGAGNDTFYSFKVEESAQHSAKITGGAGEDTFNVLRDDANAKAYVLDQNGQGAIEDQIDFSKWSNVDVILDFSLTEGDRLRVDDAANVASLKLDRVAADDDLFAHQGVTAFMLAEKSGGSTPYAIAQKGSDAYVFSVFEIEPTARLTPVAVLKDFDIHDLGFL